MARSGPLPGIVPIFPLAGILLLPRGRLPLNIFGPRYLEMTRDAMATDRLIGMIQPRNPARGGRNPPVYRTGCVGRITECSETRDGRYEITLTGICRFDIAQELKGACAYRRARVSYAPYQADFAEDMVCTIDTPHLLTLLHTYFPLEGIEVDWNTIARVPGERLVTALAMLCPFAPSEKQALLECATPGERARVLTSLIEIAVLENAGTVTQSRH